MRRGGLSTNRGSESIPRLILVAPLQMGYPYTDENPSSLLPAPTAALLLDAHLDLADPAALELDTLGDDLRFQTDRAHISFTQVREVHAG